MHRTYGTCPTCGEEEAVHLIVQAEIMAATRQDVEETMPLLGDLQARDLVPEVRLVDSSYVSGEVLASHAQLGSGTHKQDMVDCEDQF